MCAWFRKSSRDSVLRTNSPCSPPRPRRTPTYFNTGVLMVPGSSLTGLHAAWLKYIRCFIEGFPALEAVTVALRDRVPVYEQTTADDLRSLFYAEQRAFALAVSDLALPYSTLPLALNFPTIYNGDHRPGEYIRKRLLPHAIAPLIIHHHHNFEGGLEPTGYDKPDRVIQQVNEAILRRTGGGAGDGELERGGGRYPARRIPPSGDAGVLGQPRRG